MKKPNKYFVISSAFIFTSFLAFGQDGEKWIITRAVNTDLELGVSQPSNTYFNKQKNLYIGEFVYIKDSLLFFSKNLQNSNSYSDTLFIKECKTFKKSEDDEMSYRYPGDELTCEPSRVAQNKCFVGQSFMKLLGSKRSELTFYELRANYPAFYHYKLCIIKKGRKMGLFLENSLIILILEKSH